MNWIAKQHNCEFDSKSRKVKARVMMGGVLLSSVLCGSIQRTTTLEAAGTVQIDDNAERINDNRSWSSISSNNCSVAVTLLTFSAKLRTWRTSVRSIDERKRVGVMNDHRRQSGRFWTAVSVRPQVPSNAANAGVGGKMERTV